MTTEQMDWLDDERAGRHAADKLVPKRPVKDDGRSRWPFTPNPADSVKPDPMGAASLADRLRAIGAIRPMTKDGEPVEWVNAPLEVVVEQAKRAASAFPEDLHDWAATPSNGIRAWGMSGIPEIMFGDPSDEELAAAQERGGRNGVLIIPEAVRDQLFGEPSMIAAGGWCFPSDQVYNFLPTDEEIKMAKRERRKAKKARRRAKRLKADAIRRLAEGLDVPEDLLTSQTTMAEEPIENRLRRAWLNGFKDGVDRASYAATESTGRWDY